jgi:hypothetical protein
MWMTHTSEYRLACALYSFDLSQKLRQISKETKIICIMKGEFRSVYFPVFGEGSALNNFVHFFFIRLDDHLI